MNDLQNILIIARKELQDALRNRWFLLYTLIFAGLTLAVSSLSRPDIEFTELAEYNRTVASLVNLVLLFVPLIGLMFGAVSLTNEKETGVLNYLLTQPITRIEILLGKYVGMAGALLASLAFGFGCAGAILAWRGGGDAESYIQTVIMACLLALAMLSLGFLISAVSRKTAGALGGALFLWLILIFIGDLGLIGAAIVTQLPIETTVLIAMINPLQLFKMGAIFSAHASLDVLGPAGLYATQTFADSFMMLIWAGLVLWILIPLGLAQYFFSREVRAQ
jgi:Cu-processing system permease protein